MKKILFFAVAFMLCATCMQAQKKQINDAKALIKSGKSYDVAARMMTDLLKDAKNKDNDKIYITLFEALKKQYEQGNEKLYLRQKYDTAALFNLTKEMFVVLEQLDSVEMAKGSGKFKYRKKHSEFLSALRRNLFSGGGYFVRKKEYAAAFSFYDMYLDCARQPLFDKYDYGKTDSSMPMAAYWALYSGFKAGSHEKTLKYAELALKENSMREYALQLLVETYAEMKEEEKCLGALKQGFESYPDSPYFFTRLSDYYNDELKDYAGALSLAEKALQSKKDNILFLFAKSTALLNLGRYKECIEVSRKVLEQDRNLKDAYLNIGLSYFNLAITSANKAQALKEYRNSMKYVEEYRKMAPEDIKRWGTVLYNIYLNLNMGTKFDEVDRLLKSAK